MFYISLFLSYFSEYSGLKKIEILKNINVNASVTVWIACLSCIGLELETFVY